MQKMILLWVALFLALSVQRVSAGTFGGGIFDDAQAQPAGLGGTDSRCVGSTSVPVNGVGFRIRAQREGENNVGSVISNIFSVSTFTSNNDYTVRVNLPYPPPDPANAWQCACNANPLDAYQCVFTNQDPDDPGPINVFVKRANVENNAWWQVRGGSVFSRYNIQSLVPFSPAQTPGYCNTTVGCTSALIGANRQGTVDSPGFALTTDGIVHTHATGGNFLHLPEQRETSAQAFANSFTPPTESFATFWKKAGAKALPLPSSQKPTPPTAQPGIYDQEGSLTIGPDNAWHVPAGEQIIVFVQGDLIIDDTPNAQNRLITVESGGYLAFFVSGDIIITPHVGYTHLLTDPNDPNAPVVEGVFVADGTVWTQSYLTAPDRKFIGAGTFVGWTGVHLQRSFASGTNNSANNIAPVETFVFRPDFVVNTPAVLKNPQTSIREIQPQQLAP